MTTLYIILGDEPIISCEVFQYDNNDLIVVALANFALHSFVR